MIIKYCSVCFWGQLCYFSPPLPKKREDDYKLLWVLRFDSCFMWSVTSSNSPAGIRVSPRGPRRRSPNYVSSTSHSLKSNMPRELMSTASATRSTVCVAVDVNFFRSRWVRSKTAHFRGNSFLRGGLPLPRVNFPTSCNQKCFILRRLHFKYDTIWNLSYLHKKLLPRFSVVCYGFTVLPTYFPVSVRIDAEAS